MQTIVDPDQVREFARHLVRQVDSVQAELKSTHDTLRRLHSTWFDQKFGQFEGVFEDAAAHLHTFCEMAEHYAEHLVARARIIDEYLGRSY